MDLKIIGENKHTVRLLEGGGIEFSGNVSIETWRETIKGLAEVNRYYKICLGDAISYGNKTYGPQVVESELVQMELFSADVKQARAIGSIPREERIDLPAQYYSIAEELLDTVEDRVKWLNIAKMRELSKAEFRASIKRGSVVKHAEADHGLSGGIMTIESVMFMFNRWLRETQPFINKWGKKECLIFLDLIQPFANLVEQIRERANGGSRSALPDEE